jgi:lactoylglutathione lyase
VKLGAFSISLAVKDISASRLFYEKLGFTSIGGDQASGWLIMKNGSATLGLFQGMFEKNILTFNPGWDSDATALQEFDDVRKISEVLKDRGLTLTTEVGQAPTGPANFLIHDPDGNAILFDQHV